MLKPIKTVKLKTVGLGMRFVRGIMEHAASVSSYDMSESELVFAMGAARERDDLMSVLELLDEVLGLIKRGFDRHTNALTLRIINNVGIMLRRGGFSRGYFNTLEIYNKIFAAVDGRIKNFNYSECRGEIHKQIALLRAEQTKQTPGGRRGGALAFSRTRALKTFKTVSEHGTLTVNTLNSGMLQIMARNPELLKMLKLDKTFMELSLKNIESIRRRTERNVSTERFFGALTAEQVGLLERFVVDENLFSELREKSSSSDLKYLLENSSEKSLSEFFGTLKQRIEEQSVLLSERSYFDSAEEMREFFAGARRSEIERLIKELEKDRLYSGEVRTLTEALRIYETETEKRKAADVKLAELYRIAEAALKRKISTESFSEERFISALGASRELKKFFADYAWENYRSDETVKRYAEYMKNTVFASEGKTSGLEQAALRAEIRMISESAAPDSHSANGESEISAAGEVRGDDAVYDNSGLSDNGAIDNESRTAALNPAFADRMTKESFADFLINSGELNLIFSESVKNSFLNASSDVAAAFAEYLVSTVREDSFAYYSEQVRALAEKTENILYCGGANIEEQSAETFSLIYSAWNECAPQISELYANFTQSRSSHDEILKLYSHLPKNNYKAVAEFLVAASQGDAYFISLSNDFLKQSDNILNKAGVLINGAKENSEYTFYDALSGMSENALSLLMPLAGIRGGENYFFDINSDLSGQPEKLFVQMHGQPNITGSNSGNEYDFESAQSGVSESAPDLILSAGNTNAESVNFAETAKYAEFTEQILNAAEKVTKTAESANLAETTKYTEFTDRILNAAEKITKTAESVNFAETAKYTEFTDRISNAAEKITKNAESVNFAETAKYAEFTERISNAVEKIIKTAESIRLTENSVSNPHSSETSYNSKIMELIREYSSAHGLTKEYERLFSETEYSIRNAYSAGEVGNLGHTPSSLPLLNEKPLKTETSFRSFSESAEKLELKHIIRKSVADSQITKDLYQRLVFAEKASELRAVLPGVTSRSERRVFKITQGENRLENKSIVTDKAFYNALAAFNGTADDITAVINDNILSDAAYPLLTPREYFFTWESGSVTRFNRAAADKTHIRTNIFSERHSAAALTLSERISEKLSEENQRTGNNTAVELFYTDEYFESNGGIGVTGTPVNYAIPAAAASGSSDEVSEKLGNIRGTIESINTEIAGIKQREEELSREFVTKSEHKVFERELKSSIERDIYLAGKRHGIY